MKEELEKAKRTGFAVANVLEDNKLTNYRQRLISAVTTDNKTNVYNTLIGEVLWKR